MVSVEYVKSCNYCKKEASYLCKQCSCVTYCNTVCEEKDYEVHKSLCYLYEKSETKNHVISPFDMWRRKHEDILCKIFETIDSGMILLEGNTYKKTQLSDFKDILDSDAFKALSLMDANKENKYTFVHKEDNDYSFVPIMTVIRK